MTGQPESAQGAGAQQTPRFVLATRVRAALFVSGIATLLVFPSLGQWIIATADEARFALLARDAIERGAWFDLSYRGQLFRNKPPLYPWAIAAASRLAGRVTEGTAHAPVALAAIVAVLFTFLLGEQLFDRRAGVWAALILATTGGFLHMSQALLPDMLVLCFATLAGYAFWRGVTDPRTAAFVMFYVAVALAVFAKGPVGLIPLLAAGVWLWTEHGAKGVRLLWSPAGLGLFALITLTWVGPFLALGARSWAKDTVRGDWLIWYVGPPVRLVEFIHSAVLWSLPWTPVLILANTRAVRAWGGRAARFALLWFAVPFLVVMVSSHQKTRYLLPMYPGAALLVAWWATVHSPPRHGAVRALGWLVLAASAVTSVALFVPEWWGSEEARYLVTVPRPVLLALTVGIGLVAGAIFWGLNAGRPALLVHGVVIGMFMVWGTSVWPLHQRYNEIWNFRQLAAIVDQHACGGHIGIYQHRDKWGPIEFYLGRSPRSLFSVEQVNEHLGRGTHSLVLMDEGGWNALQRHLSSEARVLHQSTIGGESLLVVGTAACGEPATRAVEAVCGLPGESSPGHDQSRTPSRG